MFTTPKPNASPKGDPKVFNIFSTLIRGANARATEVATDHFALDLIAQKIREAEQGLSSAKQTLATLILRQRQEQKLLATLTARKSDLESRAKKALGDDNEELALQAARAIADLENEQTVRKETLSRLNSRVERMRLSIEKTHRRIIDLRQGANTASAMDMERKAQRKLNRAIGNSDAIREAEALVARVANQDDPYEQGEVLDEIDRSLSHETVRDRLAEAGYGASGKTRAKDVLARLRKK